MPNLVSEEYIELLEIVVLRKKVHFVVRWKCHRVTVNLATRHKFGNQVRLSFFHRFSSSILAG